MQTIALIHHVALCITWSILPVKAKIALWERHRKNLRPINERLK